jgi:O-antigen ligase
VGIYLTASRSGFYILLLCAVIYVVYRMRSWRINPAIVPALVAVAALLGSLALMVVDRPGGLGVDATQGSVLGRVLDVTESTSTELGVVTRSDVTAQALQAAFDAPWFGYGVFTFQGTEIASLQSPLPLGAHDIYLVAWGEAGIAGLVLYLLVLGIGINGMVRSALPERVRLLLGLLWISYLIIGVVWHNQFTSLLATVYVGLLFRMPAAASRPVSMELHSGIAGTPYLAADGGNQIAG